MRKKWRLSSSASRSHSKDAKSTPTRIKQGKGSFFKCGKTGHFIAQCLDNENNQAQERYEKKEKKKNYRKAKGEAHLGKEWDSDCSSSDSDDEGLAASAFDKSSLFPTNAILALWLRRKRYVFRTLPSTLPLVMNNLLMMK
jgi:hypothetical protein